ncbi:hypothetical protein TL16_g05638 [Triparma laevis f. inornata]|uniref:UDENN domain-containing protein n=2 Tax=Triparma laevis TaxID=1534972 RepID=A0A9W7F2X9_9STRA|nr:hypothetical protein TL16_g05638 [Triparma laevis f. inornata]GMH98983.1 hypothetical protein TrLO_g6909 [Triparma laevis f. longispina]
MDQSTSPPSLQGKNEAIISSLQRKLKASQRSATLGFEWKRKYELSERRAGVLQKQNSDLRKALVRWRSKFGAELESRQELVWELAQAEDRISHLLDLDIHGDVEEHTAHMYEEGKMEMNGQHYGQHAHGQHFGEQDKAQHKVQGHQTGACTTNNQQHQEEKVGEMLDNLNFWSRGEPKSEADKGKKGKNHSRPQGRYTVEVENDDNSSPNSSPSARVNDSDEEMSSEEMSSGRPGIISPSSSTRSSTPEASVSPKALPSALPCRYDEKEDKENNIGGGNKNNSINNSNRQRSFSVGGKVGQGGQGGQVKSKGAEEVDETRDSTRLHNNIRANINKVDEDFSVSPLNKPQPVSPHPAATSVSSAMQGGGGTPTFDHFLVVGADLENRSTKPHVYNNLIDEITLNLKQKAGGFFGNFNKSKVEVVEPPKVKPTVLMHYGAKDGFKDLPTSADSIANFCFPQGISVRQVNLKESMSDVNAIFYGPYCHRGDGSFIFTFNDDTGLVDGQTNSSTLYGVCVTQPRLVGSLEVPRVYCILTRIPHFDLHFRVLWDVIAAQRIGRLPVDGAPGFDKHGYDTLDFIKQTFIRYSTVNIDGDVGEFVSFQVCSHLPPITFRPVPTINKLLKDCTESTRESILYNSMNISGGELGLIDRFKNPWNKLRRESISATKEWALPPLFSVVPADILADVIGELMKETQLIVLSTKLSMLSSTVLGLVYLLKPLLWVAPMIPLLPHNLNDFFQAPVPYIVGYPASALPEDAEVPEGVAILNLDHPDGVKFEVTRDVGRSQVDIALGIGGGGGGRGGMPGKVKLLESLKESYGKINNVSRKAVTKGIGGVAVTKITPIYEPSVEQGGFVVEISNIIRMHVCKLVMVFLDKCKSSQMFSSFADEEQHRINRKKAVKLSGVKFRKGGKGDGGEVEGGKGRRGGGGGGGGGRLNELYASPQKLVVRVHQLAGVTADPRQLSLDGYVK